MKPRARERRAQLFTLFKGNCSQRARTPSFNQGACGACSKNKHRQALAGLLPSSSGNELGSFATSARELVMAGTTTLQ